MEINGGNWYLCRLFVILSFCISIASANQEAVCLDNVDIPGFMNENISWELTSTSSEATTKLIFSYPYRVRHIRENYTVKDGGLVMVKGTNQKGEEFIFFNNNWQYNVHNGKFDGLENGWTLLVNKTVYVFKKCIVTDGAGFPSRNPI